MIGELVHLTGMNPVQQVYKCEQLTSLVNLHLMVAQPSCMIPLDPNRTSYIHLPEKKDFNS